MIDAAAIRRRSARRGAADRRLRLLSRGAVMLSLAIVGLLLGAMIVRGATGFVATRIALPVTVPAHLSRLPAELSRAADAAYPREGGAALLADGAIRRAAAILRDAPQRPGTRVTLWLPVASAIDVARKRGGTQDAERIVAALDARGVLSLAPDVAFVTGVDATDPASAGIRGALVGSLLTIAVTLAVAVPLGVLAAIWLAEFASVGRFTDAIAVSISNLAAVPSIIFGLLGLAFFLGTLHLPRSSALVAGLTLALMTMPIIVITSRAAIEAVSPSIRDAARALGASPVQVVVHHVLPLAAPGMLTGIILATARALGETAPLLLIGMRAFIAAAPRGASDPATVLPMQIFLWSDEVDGGFVERTAAAILVLLGVLMTLNAIAMALRARFEAKR